MAEINQGENAQVSIYTSIFQVHLITFLYSYLFVAIVIIYSSKLIRKIQHCFVNGTIILNQ